MATIIKRESQPYASGTRVGGVAYDLTDMAGQADEYLGDVHGEASKIIEEARREAIAIRKQAEVAGRQAAEKAIERILDEKVSQQMKTLTPALADAVKQINESRQEWLKFWETSAVQFACAIANRIVRREIQHKPELPAEWVTESLQLCAGAAEITLKLNPADHATLGGQIAQLAAEFNPAAQTKIVADPTISVSGSRVETEFGAIDQQIETQLERVAQELS